MLLRLKMRDDQEIVTIDKKYFVKDERCSFCQAKDEVLYVKGVAICTKCQHCFGTTGLMAVIARSFFKSPMNVPYCPDGEKHLYAEVYEQYEEELQKEKMKTGVRLMEILQGILDKPADPTQDEIEECIIAAVNADGPERQALIDHVHECHNLACPIPGILDKTFKKLGIEQPEWLRGELQ